MQFKLDENLPPSVADLLLKSGHSARTVYEQGLRSCSDPEVISACQAEGLALLSLDLDFSNILIYPPEQYAGLIVLRLRRAGPRAVTSLVRRLLPHLATVPVAGRLWIVDERRIRVRLVGEIDLGPEVREVPLE
jgi:predicted nuclease of predicted toxin-antitoxin system